MATKPTLTTISGSAVYSAATLNRIHDELANAIRGCLGRNGVEGSPNSMTAALDMDHNKIQNLPQPAHPLDAVNKEYVDSVVSGSTALESAIVYGSMAYDIFTGDGNTTDFVLSASPHALNNLLVTINGVVQQPTVHYTWPASTTLHFILAPSLGAVIGVKYAQALTYVGVAGDDVVEPTGAASTPLSSTDTVLVWQNGAAHKASVADLVNGLPYVITVFPSGADDTTLIQNALDEIATLGVSGTLRLPGRYTASAPLTYTGVGSIVLEGTGYETSEIAFTHNGDGLIFHFAQWKDGIVQIRNLSVSRAAAATSATAIQVYCDSYVSSPTSIGCTLENLWIGHKRGTVAANVFWTNGVRFNNIPHPNVINCFFLGKTTENVGYGIKFEDNAVTPLVSKCRLYNYDTAIIVSGVQSEGVVIANTWITAGATGIYIDTTGTEPGLYLSDCEIDVHTYGIYAEGRVSFSIKDTFFFKNETKGESATHIDIYLDNCYSGQINGCHFKRNSGGGTTQGVVVNATAGSTLGLIRVTDCDFENRTTGFIVGSDVRYFYAADNSFYNCAARYTNNSTAPASQIIIAGDLSTKAASYMIRMATGNNQAIANNSLSMITAWTGGSDRGGGTQSVSKLIVPDGAGAVRVSANIRFASNDTGLRQARILRNGVVWTGMPDVTRRAVSGEGTLINLNSSIVNCSPGDYFEVQVKQSSGGSLNVEGNAATWFTIEVVA